jgi:predicted dehydrogenase
MNMNGMDRRRFLVGVAAAAATVSIVKSSAVYAVEANSKIQIGLIGGGGRGGFLAGLFAENGNYAFAAMHDYFADRANGLGDKHGVPADRRFSGLSGYKKLLETKLDAVDVPGCRSIEASGKKATESKHAFLVDFQTRVDPLYMEAVKRVHEGAIGELALGESTYHCGRLGAHGEDKTPEGRLRNWVFDKALSGDIITEQNIHTLDVMSWIMNAPPVRAFGTCARKVRVDVGDCNDCFAATFEYPGNVGMAYSGRQFDAHGTQEGIRNRMFGSLGVLETEYGGQVLIRGKNFWRGGSNPAIYKDGAKANIAAFHKQITESQFENPTVAHSVRSNLVTILGRTAAYTGELVTWEKLLKSEERIDGRLQGLKD